MRQLFGGTIDFAGGVATGGAIRAAEVLGADLAYLGTRFIASQESLAAAEYKAMIVQGSADDLVYTDRITGVPASWLRRSLDTLGKAGLKVVLGTPTATPPTSPP